MKISKFTIACLGLIFLSGCGTKWPAEPNKIKPDERPICKQPDLIPPTNYDPKRKNAMSDRLINQNTQDRQNRDEDLQSYLKYNRH